jgi:hypothetical protein
VITLPLSLALGPIVNQAVYLITGDREITDAAKEPHVDAQVLK